MKAYCLFCKHRKIVNFKRMCKIKNSECPSKPELDFKDYKCPECNDFTKVHKIVEYFRKLRLMFLLLMIKAKHGK